jgi:RNA polymerase-binding protein DksA
MFKKIINWQKQVMKKKDDTKKKSTPSVRRSAASPQREGSKKASPAVKKKPAPVYTKTSEYLNEQEVEHYKQLLLDKMREIVGDVNSIEDEALKKSRLDASGDLSSMPIHMADIGTDNYEQEFSLNLLDGERKMLRDIIEALQKIDEGIYGICEVTGRGISKDRLEARPWARYCIEYAKLVEKGIVREGEPVPEGIELD